MTVWGETRARGGRVLLRIEDHDRQRSRRQFETALLEDLAWLGFEADGPTVRQSDRDQIYINALDHLRDSGLVYACSCSRSDLARSDVARPDVARADAARADIARPDVARAFQARDSAGPGGAALRADEPCYPGTCRNRGLVEGPGVGLRVRLEPSVERFVDLRLGPQEQRPSDQCGDLLVRDRDGNWTYQFAVAVDDYVQGVTLVIRGTDLLSSTGRQIQLARLLGRIEPPEFLHHALIMKTPQQKLSKSDGATGIRELRERGWTPGRVIAHAMQLVNVSGGNCHGLDG